MRVMGGAADGAEWLISGGPLPDRIEIQVTPGSRRDMPWMWLPADDTASVSDDALIYERATPVEQFDFERIFYPAG